MRRVLVAQTCLDMLGAASSAAGKPVLAIGATNRPDAIDSALRRAGRFDREICVGIPDTPARARMLAVLMRGMRLGPDVDVAALAAKTPGYVGADIRALCGVRAPAAARPCSRSRAADVRPCGRRLQ